MGPTDISHQVLGLRAHPHGRGDVQVGLERLRSLLLSGVTAAERSALVGLGPSSTTQLRALAGRPGTPARTASVLLGLARAAERAAGPAPRRHTVAVTGAGALAAAVREVLRPHAVVAEPSDGAPGAGPAVAVCVSADVADLARLEQWGERGTPTVPVVDHGDRILVGPLLRRHEGPCGGCLERYATDRDPGRAVLAAALLDAGHTNGPDPALSALAAGMTALLVGQELSGSPHPTGLGMVVSGRRPHLTYHAWSAHPACRCAPERVPVPAVRSGAASRSG